MMLKRFTVACGATVLMAGVPVVAQSQAGHTQHHPGLVVGSTVTIEGCVSRGTDKDTYVLGTVTEVPAHLGDATERRVYWLDSRRHVRDKVGQRVQLTGKIDKIGTSEIEVKNTDDGVRVELEGMGRQVATTSATVPVPTSGAKETSLKTTVLRLKVDKVTSKGGC